MILIIVINVLSSITEPKITHFFLSFNSYLATEEPEFTEIIENVTVPAGRNVRMACSVKNLGSFKV